ncbi:MAG: hypothetical protein IT210_15210 [Armatimonadetes bacterium]|nr:hypothetical protein [Armatimonadota bacterium]
MSYVRLEIAASLRSSQTASMMAVLLEAPPGFRIYPYTRLAAKQGAGVEVKIWSDLDRSVGASLVFAPSLSRSG